METMKRFGHLSQIMYQTNRKFYVNCQKAQQCKTGMRKGLVHFQFIDK